MSAEEFEILYNAVANKTAGWDDALIAAWPCLIEHNRIQINLLLVVA